MTPATRSQHIAFLEAVNAARTQHDHDVAEARLRGFRAGVIAGAYDPALLHGQMLAEADNHYLGQGVDRPMCGGVFLDWEPS